MFTITLKVATGGVFLRKDVLGNFAKFTWKHLCQRQPATLLKKRLGSGVFLWILRNFEKLRINFFTEDLWVTASALSKKSIEGKTQWIWRKFQSRSKEYCQLYPAGSYRGKLHDAAIIQKLPPNGCVDNLPLRPILLNIDIAIYQWGKYWAYFYLL